MAKFLNLSKDDSQVTTRTISVQYDYPHYHNTLEGVSSLYLMRLPVNHTKSYSFSLLFVKVRLPQLLKTTFKSTLQVMIRRFFFQKFLQQDIEMINSEQQTYLANPKRRYVEVNPAITALQRVIVEQYDQYQTQSNKEGYSEENQSSGMSHSSEHTSDQPSKKVFISASL